MLRTLQPQRLSDGVVSELATATRAGRLRQGEKFSSERQLSEQLGVSRVSVREGLRMLELIEIRAGDTSAARAAMQAHIAETRTDIGSMPDQGAI